VNYQTLMLRIQHWLPDSLGSEESFIEASSLIFPPQAGVLVQ